MSNEREVWIKVPSDSGVKVEYINGEACLVVRSDRTDFDNYDLMVWESKD